VTKSQKVGPLLICSITPPYGPESQESWAAAPPNPFSQYSPGLEPTEPLRKKWSFLKLTKKRMIMPLLPQDAFRQSSKLMFLLVKTEKIAVEMDATLNI
jgi:hypothetical protein